MKIRIKENTIRLRLTKSEMDRFFREEHFTMTTDFGDARFIYTLEVSNALKQIEATYINNEIKVLLPRTLFKEWQNADCVGFSNQYEMQDGKNMLVKVEKDFACLDDTDEDQSDNFPNPRKV